MKELSPAAQAVKVAAVDAYWLLHPGQAAALLRAAADQVVPEEPPHPHANSPEAERFGTPEDWAYAGIERDARQEARVKLLAIATELDPSATPPVA